MVRLDSVRSLGRFLRVGTIVGVALLLVGSSWGLGSRAAQAQGRKQIFLSVMESNGVPVLDLKPSDVTVFENQVRASVAKVEPIEWPMRLTVLVDNGARASDYLSELRTGLRNFFNEIPDGVEVSLLTLAPQPRWVLRPTTDLQKEIKSVNLLAPDNGAAKFFDGLAEAAARIEKDRGDYFPVILLITSDVGGSDPPLDRDWQRLQKRVNDHGATVHVVTLTTGTTTTRNLNGSMQTYIGIPLTELTGGRYENINSASRLVTLLPEIGQQIARSHFLQTHQYRVTYEPTPSNSKEPSRVSVTVATHGPVNVTPTLNGRLP